MLVIAPRLYVENESSIDLAKIRSRLVGRKGETSSVPGTVAVAVAGGQASRGLVSCMHLNT